MPCMQPARVEEGLGMAERLAEGGPARERLAAGAMQQRAGRRRTSQPQPPAPERAERGAWARCGHKTAS